MRRYVLRSFRDRLRRDDMRPERGAKVATRVRVRCEKCGTVAVLVEEYAKGLLINAGGTFSDDVDTIECPTHGPLALDWLTIEIKAEQARHAGKPLTVRAPLR